MKISSLNQILESARMAVRRFPHVLLCSVVTCWSIWALIASDGQSKIHLRLGLTFSLGMVSYIALAVFDERYTMRRHTVYLMHGMLAAALAFFYFSLPESPGERQVYQYLILLVSAHLAVSFSPFVVNDEVNGFWQYNKSLFLRFVVSVIYSAVLFAGLALALLSIDQLFDLNVDERNYVRLFAFIAFVFNTWLFSFGIPTQVARLEQQNDYPKGLKVFTQFVLLPLVTVYLIILYSYAGKILLSSEWPRGWVSYLVIGFSCIGILALLLIWPLRNQENNTWIRTYARWFFRALFPLILLLAFAIGRRISDYGITEDRYLVLALALWLFCNALYFLFSRIKNIRFIPMSLFVFCLFCGFSPWNAFRISERSQLNRLLKIAEKNKLLQNGTFVKGGAGFLTDSAKTEINSISRYLISFHGPQALNEYLPADAETIWNKSDDEDWTDSHALAFMEWLDSDTQAGDSQIKSAFYAEIEPNRSYKVEQGELINLDLQSSRSGNYYEYRMDSTHLSLRLTEGVPALEGRINSEAFRIPLEQWQKSMREKGKMGQAIGLSPAEVYLHAETNRYDLHIHPRSMRWEYAASGVSSMNLQGILIVERK